MTDNQVTLDARLREIAKNAMLETAAHREWNVHVIKVRSNHVHVVVTAPDRSASEVMRVLKAYASRAMNAVSQDGVRKWWTRQGSKRKMFTDKAIFAAIRYVENQDISWMKHH